MNQMFLLQIPQHPDISVSWNPAHLSPPKTKYLKTPNLSLGMGMDVQGGHTMEYFTPVFNLRNSL